MLCREPQHAYTLFCRRLLRRLCRQLLFGYTRVAIDDMQTLPLLRHAYKDVAYRHCCYAALMAVTLPPCFAAMLITLFRDTLTPPLSRAYAAGHFILMSKTCWLIASRCY